MPQLTIFEKTSHYRGKTTVRNVVTVEHQLLNLGLFGFLLSQVPFHRQAIAFVQVIALQVEHVTPNLGVDGERHHFLIVAIVHIVDVRVLSGVVQHRVFCQLVKNLLINMLSGSSILVLALFIVIVKRLDQFLEGVLKVIRLHELLQDKF